MKGTKAGVAILASVLCCLWSGQRSAFVLSGFDKDKRSGPSKVARSAVHTSKVFDNSRKEIVKTLRQLKGTAVASDLSTILRMVDIAQYQLALESIDDDIRLDGHLLRLGSKYRLLRDMSEDAISNIKHTSQNFQQVLQLVWRRMNYMRADKAWQDTLRIMANDLEPVAKDVRSCGDHVKYVVREAKMLSKQIQYEKGWCAECDKNSTELFNALDRIVLLSSGLGSLVAEFYDYLHEGVQECAQQSANRMHDDFTISWEDWQATGVDSSDRMRRQLTGDDGGELLPGGYDDVVEPFQQLEERCNEYLRASRNEACSRISRRGSRALKHWVVRVTPPSISEALPGPPERTSIRLLLRKLSTWLHSVPGRVKMTFARKQSIAANAVRLGDSKPPPKLKPVKLTTEQKKQVAKKTLVASGMNV